MPLAGFSNKTVPLYTIFLKKQTIEEQAAAMRLYFMAARKNKGRTREGEGEWRAKARGSGAGNAKNVREKRQEVRFKAARRERGGRKSGGERNEI